MAGITFAVRFLHLAASMLPLGLFAFVCLIGRPAAARAGAPAEAALAEFAHEQWRFLAGCLIFTFVSGLGAFVLQSTIMSGESVMQTLTAETIRAVLATQYGKAWLLRQVLLILLAGVAVLLVHRERPSSVLLDAGFALAAAFVGSVVLTGHAAAGEGAQLILQLGADVLHLIAAGTWLGALLPLALLLDWCRCNEADWARLIAQEATRRFSWLGIATVSTLVLTGLINAWQLVGDIPPLVGTTYGRLLLIKLGLLVPLLALAATNLLYLRPRLLAAGRSNGFDALAAHLRRNALLEAGVGAAVLLIVAMLGITAPARHAQPDWPFTFRYSWEINKNLPEKRFPVVVGKTFPERRISILLGAGLATAALLPFGYALIRRRYRGWALGVGIAAVSGGAALALPALWVDAYPTTYRRPAVPYQAISVESGLQTYRQYCVPCHGVAGFGDGPVAASLASKPTDLTAKHTNDHTAGDLFWWLTHGKEGTPMPGFGTNLSEEGRWDLINYLRALSAAEQARRMAPLIESPWLVAPDFVYRTQRGENKNLKDYRAQKVVLLMLFTWPQSEARLSQLQALHERLSAAGVALLAVPADAASLDDKVIGLLDRPDVDLIVDGSEEIFATYSLFRRSLSESGMRPDAPPPAHMEFLIDRQGYVRARWIATESRGWTNADILLHEMVQLNQEKLPAPAPDDHVH